MDEPVIVWYLEMTSPGELQAAREPGADVEIARVQPPSPELSRRLYEQVGGPYAWTDRLGWGEREWAAHLGRDGVKTLVAWVGGEPAGYSELVTADGDVELTSFGLREAFIGRGLGGALLHAAVRRAWEQAPGRVWLHTCSLDSPVARPNYEKRGFRLYDTQTV